MMRWPVAFLVVVVVATGAMASVLQPVDNQVVDAWTRAHPLNDIFVVFMATGGAAANIDGVRSLVADTGVGNGVRVLGVAGHSEQEVAAMFPTAIVSPNRPVWPDQTTWNLDRLDERALANADGTWTGPPNGGNGITGYIVDSGVTVSHADFEGRAENSFTAYGDFVDRCEHGTHVAGTMGGETRGVARGIALRSVKVLDGSRCEGTTLTLAQGLAHVLANAVGRRAIINLSLGFSGFDAVIGSLVAQLRGAGHLVLGAAGNDGRSACNHYPSSYSGVLAVAATNRFDTAAAFSNYGSCVDMYAPGVDIESADGDGSGYRSLSGTSMAVPHAGGVAALLWQASPASTGTQIGTALLQAATRGAVTNRRGSPDLLAYWGTEPQPPLTATTTASSSSGLPPPVNACTSVTVSLLTLVVAVALVH